MATNPLEERVAALEAEIARIRATLGGPGPSVEPWWERISGTFVDDPAHAEAMELGRKYRESRRPRPARPRKP